MSGSPHTAGRRMLRVCYVEGSAVNAVKAICCFALFCGPVIVNPALAQATGQQRAQSAGRAILGSPAPRLTLRTIDGDAIDLGSLYGKKAVYLKFWATWCVPCRQQMPHFEHAYETAGPDMAVIAINVGFNDSIEAIRGYRKQLGITMPIVFDDGSLAAAFHLRVTPTHIVIARDGRIRYIGHLADQELDAALIAARAPSHATAHGTAVAGPDPAAIGVGDLLPKKTLRTLDGRRFEFQPSAAQPSAAQPSAAQPSAAQPSSAQPSSAPPSTAPPSTAQPGAAQQAGNARHTGASQQTGASERKITALVFLSPWCESYLATTRPAVSASCRNSRMQIETLAADPRLRWLGIASGLWANSEDLRRYRAQYKVTIPLTLDASGEVFRAFRVNDVPTILIADADGRVVRRIEGSAAQDGAALRAAVSGL
jgi:thiol-disulfide isomerase/thioredoxin